MNLRTLAELNKAEAEVKRLTALLESHGINPQTEELKNSSLNQKVNDSLTTSLSNIAKGATISRIQ
jgi:hypothetical protein